ncbi:DnaD domain protein [Bacillus sp. REN16]|uniref:DnaD domain protein n=1 Tax=Bacillus sp. REN16 TaxID=2887296 RepID=UPI001E30F330
MKLAVENSSKRWNYVEAVLRDWKDKGHQTLDDVHAARLAYKNQMNHQSRKKPTRHELLPDWYHYRDQDHEPEHTPDFEEKKRILEDRLKKYKGQETSDPLNPSFEEKKALFEQRLKMRKSLRVILIKPSS